MAHVVIIGGGLAGLTAAYHIVKAGHRVTVVEQTGDFGGLAASEALEGHTVEKFYHFICRTDSHLTALVEELGIGGQLEWRHSRTAFFYNGRLYNFGTPKDLLSFSPIPFSQRIRFGLHILGSRHRRDWHKLDRIGGKDWLVQHVGEHAYRVIWEPLLRVKFGEYHDRISAAWIWQRIWRVARSRRSLVARECFGYLRDGCSSLFDALLIHLQKDEKVHLMLNTSAEKLKVDGSRACGVYVNGQFLASDFVLSTIALPGVQQLLPEVEFGNYREELNIPFIGIVCARLSLTNPLTSCFWLNINDPRISFNGIIEQTNLNEHWRTAGLNIAYIPFYLPTSLPRYDYSDEALLDEYVPMLRLINSEFDISWIKEFKVFRAAHAQPICMTDFAGHIPSHRTPIKAFFVTDATQFYPEDRTMSAVVDQASKVSRLIIQEAYGVS